MREDADRGQSIQVGAVLLFGVLVMLLATWQAVVVPQENESIEFNHNREVQGQVQELRNAIISLGDGGTTTGVRVKLGTTYPTRILFVNPSPPSGSIRTVGTRSPLVNVSIQNASAAGDAGDFWDGTAHNYTTGGMVYEPTYNLYTNAPRTTYENSVLYNDFGDQNLTLAGQTLVDGNRITLVTLNGSLSRTRTEATTVDVRPVTASRSRLGVVNATAGQRLTISIPTQLSAQNWTTLLDDQFVTNGGHVTGVSEGPAIAGTDLHLVSIHLERGVSYRLSLARVGVGTGVDTTIPAQYLTKTAGNGSVVPEDTTKTLEVAVWDRFNNPVAGVAVEANTSRSDSSVTVAGTSDGDGRIELRYEAPSDIDGGAKTDDVNVSMTIQPSTAGAGFDAQTATNVTFDLTVDNTDRSGTGGGGGGVYNVSWDNPIDDNPGANLTNCDSDRCVWDVGTSADNSLTLRGSTSPVIEGITLDFGINDSTVATISPGENTTASNGEATTELTAISEGTVTAFVGSGGSSDDIVIEVRNVTGGFVYNNDAVAVDENGDGTAAAVRFSMDNRFSQSLTINEVEIDPQSPEVAAISDGYSGQGPYRNELFVDSSPTPGFRDFGGGTMIPADGLTMDLSSDQEAVVDSGTTATYYLSKFLDQRGNSGNFEEEGMSDETVDVVVRYTLADGTTGSTTFTIHPA